MVALLAEVAKRPNNYIGDEAIAELEARVESEPDPVQKMGGLHQLTWHDLRLGEDRRAIKRITAAKALIPLLPPDQRHAELHLDYMLAVAWLRLGENENCVADHSAESCIMPLRGGAIHRKREGSTNAIKWLTRVIEHPRTVQPRRVAAGWLLNIAHMTLGTYPKSVPPEFLIKPSAFSSPNFKHFPNIAADLGLDRNSLSGGGVADDLDGDGDIDIATSSWDPRQRMALWRNNGDGTFTEYGVEAGVGGITGGLNMIHADYDNDGDVDLFVLRGAWLNELGNHPNSLLQNDGKGNFTDVTFAAGLGANHYPTQTAGFADYDLDGDLDLYIGNEALSPTGSPNELFRNEGDGTFKNVTAQAGVDDRRFTKGIAWADFDLDRYPDIYVSNAGAANRLYRNKGDGTFVDVAEAKRVTEPHVGFPTWWWDYDNDGHLDLVAFNGYGPHGDAPPVWNVAARYMGLPHEGEKTRLYRANGAGGFEDVAERTHFPNHTLTMGCNFGDFDNDGFLDAYLGTGYPEYEGLMPNVALRNFQGERFRDVSFSSGMAHLQKGHGVAFADFDQDGDLDLFEQMGGAFPGDAFGNVLYENPGFNHNWLAIDAVGVQSNRSAIGARIRVVLDAPPGHRASTREIHRRVGTGGSFGGNPLRQHIGLGNIRTINRVEVYWPRSKILQVFKNPPINRLVRVTEGKAELEPLRYEATRFRKKY